MSIRGSVSPSLSKLVVGKDQTDEREEKKGNGLSRPFLKAELVTYLKAKAGYKLQYLGRFIDTKWRKI